MTREELEALAVEADAGGGLACALIAHLARHVAAGEIIIERIQALTLKAGDILALKLAFEPSNADAQGIRDILTPVVPEGTKILVMGPATEFSVVSPE